MADSKKKSGGAGSAASVSGTTSLDVEALRQIVGILEASEITRLVWANGDEKLVIRRGEPSVTHVVQQAAVPVSGAGVQVVTPGPVTVPPSASEGPRPRASAPAKATSTTEGGDKKGHIITSPFVGTFYRNPAPDQPPFVEAGAVVKKGQVLCIVEAMKLMNEIESEVSGRVSEILVQNAQPVEFGQPLFRVEPA